MCVLIKRNDQSVHAWNKGVFLLWTFKRIYNFLNLLTFACLAQLVEHVTFNHRAVGSSPTTSMIFFHKISFILSLSSFYKSVFVDVLIHNVYKSQM